MSRCRRTVRLFARAASAEELFGGATSKESKLDSFKPEIGAGLAGWAQGTAVAGSVRAA